MPNTDRIPPSNTKQPPQPTAVKLQIRAPNHHNLRPKKGRLHHTNIITTPTSTRTCCCCCLIWFVIIILLLTVAVGATCGVLWILYRPQIPKFTIASLKLTNLTFTGNLDADASGRLYTSGNLTISAKNPNSKLTVLYDVVSMSVYSNRSNVLIANSTFQPFVSFPGNWTVMRFVIRNWRILDLEAARGLRSELMGRRSIVIGTRLELDTKMGVQIGKWRSMMVGIRIKCSGLRLKKNWSAAADAWVSESGGKCEVDVSNKIWGFTL